MPNLPEGMESGHMYNHRTAHKIYGWFAEGKRKMLFQKVIASVQKAAWDESKSVLRNGSNPLAAARNGSSRIWWEGLKTIPASRRREEGLVFTRTGPQSFWEDPLVAIWGLEWRSKRDGCGQAAWISRQADFVNELSKRWSLPTFAKKLGQHDKH